MPRISYLRSESKSRSSALSDNLHQPSNELQLYNARDATRQSVFRVKINNIRSIDPASFHFPLPEGVMQMSKHFVCHTSTSPGNGNPVKLSLTKNRPPPEQGNCESFEELVAWLAGWGVVSFSPGGCLCGIWKFGISLIKI